MVLKFPGLMPPEYIGVPRLVQAVKPEVLLKYVSVADDPDALGKYYVKVKSQFNCTLIRWQWKQFDGYRR